MMVYAVFKEGVYRHQCGGVFGTVQEAIIAASELAQEDVDNYHSYDVYGFELGKKLYKQGNKIIQPNSLYSARKL